MPPKNFTLSTTVHKDFETTIAIVQGFIIKNCPPPKPDHDDLTGDKVLGPKFNKPGNIKVDGVGLDNNRRVSLRIDLNAFLNSVNAVNSLKSGDVGAKTTIDALANKVFDLWP